MFFSVQGTGGSPTGPDPEKRVGDQDIGSIAQSIKIRLYKTIIRPVMTYGAETWTLTSKMEKMLMTWERKILRKIYGPTKENGQWRIKTNEKLMTKYKAPDIVKVIKIRRLEWLGHVVRMNETRPGL